MNKSTDSFNKLLAACDRHAVVRFKEDPEVFEAERNMMARLIGVVKINDEEDPQTQVWEVFLDFKPFAQHNLACEKPIYRGEKTATEAGVSVAESKVSYYVNMDWEDQLEIVAEEVPAPAPATVQMTVTGITVVTGVASTDRVYLNLKLPSAFRNELAADLCASFEASPGFGAEYCRVYFPGVKVVVVDSKNKGAV